MKQITWSKRKRIPVFLFLFVLLFFSCNGTDTRDSAARQGYAELENSGPPLAEDNIPLDAQLIKGEDSTYAPAFIFTLQDGKVVVDSLYIDSFSSNSSPSQELIIYQKQIGSKKQTFEYHVSLYMEAEYFESQDPGEFNIIKLSCEGEEILNLSNREVWDTIPGKLTQGEPEYFLVVPLSDQITALLFSGYLYGSGPSPFTIIVLNGKEASVVYNKEVTLFREVVNESDHFSSYFLDYTDFYMDDKEPVDYPMQFRMWSDKGLLKIQKIGYIQNQDKE